MGTLWHSYALLLAVVMLGFLLIQCNISKTTAVNDMNSYSNMKIYKKNLWFISTLWYEILFVLTSFIKRD